MPPIEKLRIANRPNGFSLVEVAISMAVVSFALVSILGMVPIGMTNFRQAMNNTVESQIVQSLTSDLELASFSQLAATPTFYFDADGNPANATTQVYTATITVASVNGTAQPVNLVSSSSNVPSQVRVTAETVTISLCNRTQPNQIHKYSIIVANQNN
jgi:uncharacterized protein (TIGR02598 family)